MYRLTEPYVDKAATIKALTEVVESNYFTQGPRVREFERAWAGSVGVLHAVACNSGTTALHLALRALELPGGSRVAVSTYTCIASALPIIYEQHAPVFVDCDPQTLNMDPRHLDALLAEGDVDAVIGVHVYGQAFPWDIVGMCIKHQVPLIEDCAEAHGAWFANGVMPAGAAGQIGCFSFRGDKMITAGGAGGACVTDDEVLDARMREARDMCLPRPRHRRYDAAALGSVTRWPNFRPRLHSRNFRS